MRISDFSTFSKREILQEAVGREYQHLEDLLIDQGADGGIEALQGLAQICQNPSQMNVKWDGIAAVFWGRDPQGTFLFAPQNQWTKKIPLTREQLSQEIMQTGKPRAGQSAEEFAAIRQEMSDKYQRLWDIFQAATPKTFRGYLNGDLMFTEKPERDPQGNYVFTPNKVKYVVSPRGFSGKIATAEVFVAVHGKVDDFGASPTGNMYSVPDKVVEEFNHTPRLIALPTQHPDVPLTQDLKKIQQAIQFIKQNKTSIDKVAQFSAPKMTTFPAILYKYAVQRAKKETTWEKWLPDSKLSANQLAILDQSGITKGDDWKKFWQTFDLILNLKHQVLDELQTKHGDDLYKKFGLRAYTQDQHGGEGYAWALSPEQMAKMVNPLFRSAPDNPRYAQSS